MVAELSIGKNIMILIVLFTMVLIAVSTMLGKTRIAIALSVFEAFLVASSSYLN